MSLVVYKKRCLFLIIYSGVFRNIAFTDVQCEHYFVQLKGTNRKGRWHAINANSLISREGVEIYRLWFWNINKQTHLRGKVLQAPIFKEVKWIFSEVKSNLNLMAYECDQNYLKELKYFTLVSVIEGVSELVVLLNHYFQMFWYTCIPQE